jgi:hypothetical protein
LTGEKNTFNAEVEIAEAASTTQVEYANGDDKTMTVSYMQSITPSITLGGSGTYSLTRKSLDTAVGAMYKNDENLLAMQWDDKVSIVSLEPQLTTSHDVSPLSSAHSMSDNNFCGYFSCQIYDHNIV